jgi:hypothetical protein
MAVEMPGRIRGIRHLVCVTVIAVALGTACSGTPAVPSSPSTAVAEGYGPVSRTSNPACLLRPDEIKAAFGSPLSGPFPGRTTVIPGSACLYDQISKGINLDVYRFPTMGEQGFHSDNFPLPDLLPVTPGLQRVRVARIGDEAFSWNENYLSTSLVAFREGGDVVVVSLMVFPSLMDNNSRDVTAISLAKDAASALAS